MHNSLLYEASDFLLVILFSVGRVVGIDILDVGVDGRPTFFCVISESLPDVFPLSYLFFAASILALFVRFLQQFYLTLLEIRSSADSSRNCSTSSAYSISPYEFLSLAALMNFSTFSTAVFSVIGALALV